MTEMKTPPLLPADPGRLYFILTFWGHDKPVIKADISKVWVGEGTAELEFDGEIMSWNKWDNVPEELADKYFGADKPFFRCPQDISLPLRIFWNNLRNKIDLRLPPDILWTWTFPFFSQKFVDVLLEADIAITHKEITLCDVYGKPLKPARRAEYGPPYHLVLFPRQEELVYGGGPGGPQYKPYYHGQNELFSDKGGDNLFVTFPVVELIRKHGLRKVRVRGPYNVIPNIHPDNIWPEPLRRLNPIHPE
jgi:hypothetical protein